MEVMERATTTSPARPVTVPDELVQAALRAADELGRDVADVPTVAIADRAGMSRSTLLRRLGGSRAALHEAVRAAGIDPGGRSVRVRAVHAAAVLISEAGLAAATLEAIAGRAGCAVESLYAVFGNRDTLLGAVFDQYSPIVDIDDVLATEHSDLTATVLHVYRTVAEVLTREPRVTPAIFAEMLARPTSPAVQSLVQHKAPRLFEVIGEWLSAEIEAGRIRDLPVPLLMNQFLAPMVIHMLMRPAITGLTFVELPDVQQTCDVFADAFVRAATVDPPQPGQR
jgi:AcrR family transcriptional regulator